MKIINWLFTPKPQFLEVEDSEDFEDLGSGKIGDFEILDYRGPAAPKKDDVKGNDAAIFRLDNPDRVPIILLPGPNVKTLKRTLYGLEKTTTVAGFIRKLCVENRLNKNSFSFYFLDDSIYPNRKLLLLDPTTIEELDKKYCKSNDYLFIHMD